VIFTRRLVLEASIGYRNKAVTTSSCQIRSRGLRLRAPLAHMLSWFPLPHA